VTEPKRLTLDIRTITGGPDDGACEIDLIAEGVSRLEAVEILHRCALDMQAKERETLATLLLEATRASTIDDQIKSMLAALTEAMVILRLKPAEMGL
jgi:hypothetical protein